MRSISCIVPAAAALLLAPAGQVRADDVLSEVRLGVLAHDVVGKEHGTDLNVEALFTSPVGPAAVSGMPDWTRWLLRPRPDVGFYKNFAGYTDQLYAGVTWTADLARDVFRPGDGFFFDYGFGPALNNGYIGPAAPPAFSKVGSHVLFHLSADVGYRITPRWNISGYFAHSSNGGLARYNESLNEAGVRLGFRF
jgi:lipid A 3-O-deacylase